MKQQKSEKIMTGYVVPLTILVSLTSVLIAFNPALGYDRKALFEDFTSTTCVPCANAAAEVEAGLEQAGDEIVSSVAYHFWWPAPGNDPWWSDNQADNRTRLDYYGFNSLPTYVVDGEEYGGARTRGAFAAEIEFQVRSDSPLLIELYGDIDDQDLSVEVSVTAEEDLDDIVLYIALNENYYEYDGPSGQDDHYDAMVKMLPNGNGTEFSIDQDETEDFEFSLDLETVGWHELDPANLRLVAWVQANDEDHTVHQSEHFQLGIESPLITITNWEFSDEAEGDGDGRAEAGETCELVFSFENSPVYLPAEDVRLTLETDDEEIEIINGEFVLDELPNGEAYTNSDDPLSFRVAEDFEAHPVTFLITLSAMPDDFMIEQQISFMVEWPPILLVDATQNEDASVAMYALFGTETVPWADHLMHDLRQPLSRERLEIYDLVIWTSFNSHADIMSQMERETLQEYLDDGGVLVLAGAYMPRTLNGTTLMSEYIGAELDNEEIRNVLVRGYEDDPQFGEAILALGGGDAVWDAEITPTMEALEGGVPVFYYDRNGRNNGICGIMKSNETSRVLLLSFPIESIGGHENTNSRDDLINMIMEWSTAELSAQTDAPIANVFSLEKAYPNPFNSATGIEFTLPQATSVRLTVYNLYGQQVDEILSGNLHGGRHKATWDASELPSGQYFIRLATPQATTVQKVMLMR